MINPLRLLSRSATIPSIILFLSSISIAIFHDIGRSYLLASDSDIIYVYQALLFNEGLKQEYFDHTGYIYFVLLSIWIKVAYLFNLVDVEKLSQLPGPAAFEPSYAQLVFAGRWLSGILAGLFSVVFYFGLLLLTRNRTVSFIFAMVFALSPGLVNQSLVMRTELPAALFACLAFFLLMKAIQEYRVPQIVSLGLSCFFCMLALMSKMQIVFTVLVFPVLALIFGRSSTAADFRDNRVERTGLQLAIILGLLAFSVPSVIMIAGTISRRVNLGSGGGWYQLALVAYLIITVIVYGVVYRYPVRQVSFALVAVCSGISLGQFLHLWHHDVRNTYALANFLEHMTQFGNDEVRYTIGETGVLKGFPLIDQFLTNFWDTLKRIFFNFQWPEFPFQPVYWLVTIGVIIVLVRSAFPLALQAGALLSVSILMETITRFRYWDSSKYSILTEPWVLLAGALLVGTLVECKEFESFRPRIRQFTYSVLVLLIAIVLSLSLEKAIEGPKWQSPEYSCGLAKGFIKRLPGYFDKYCRG